MNRVVLVSASGYSSDHDGLLRSLLDRGCDLFCAVGIACELWEDIMDELAVGDGDNPRFVLTSSHPNETVEAVVEFARTFGERAEVEVVRI